MGRIDYSRDRQIMFGMRRKSERGLDDIDELEYFNLVHIKDNNANLY